MVFLYYLPTLYWCNIGDVDSGDRQASVEMLLKMEKVGDLAGLNDVRTDVKFDDVFTWNAMNNVILIDQKVSKQVQNVLG